MATSPAPLRSPWRPGRLAGPELFAWLALRRVDRGGIARLDGRYYDRGRRVPCFLLDVFDELVEADLLTLAEPDPYSGGLSRAALTCEGRARFAALSERENS
ncbi:MAG: hypothetical protein ACT4NY_06935 [Pseudonocardiales bacterium]